MIGNPAQLSPGSRDNTGNIIHGHAARSLFADARTITSDSSAENIERVRGEITHLGFVAATMLHVKKPPKYIEAHARSADFVEKLDLPVCAFGFGCHAHLGDTVAGANVDPRSVRLLRVLAERSATVGVRGSFTADLCAKYGVKNVTVVGCQSAYVAALNNSGRRTFQTLGERPVVNLSLGPDERPLLRLAMEAGAGIIGQGDPTEEKIAQGLISREDFLADQGDLWLAPSVLAAMESGAVTRAEYHDYIRAHFFKFYSVPEWRAHIERNYDFCVGTRFHGNMAALQAGVPALWIEHDMRTRELCEHLGLPSVPHARLNEYRDLRELAGECSYDAFWAKMPDRARAFLDYLRGNGVSDLLAPQVAEGLRAIARGE